VAIESDGTEQYRRMTVRERSRLRPQLLERLGWRYMPLWTIEVFTDPSACADRIGGYLGLEKPAVSGRRRTSPGFFDDDVENLAVIDAQASGARALPPQAPSAQAPSARASPGWPDGAHQQATATDSTNGSEETGGMSADGDIRDNSAEDSGAEHERGEHSSGEHSEVENQAREHDVPAEEAPAEEAPAEEAPRQTLAHAAVPSAVLPNKAAEDDPRRWGDQPSGYDHDSWLQEQKPPHWG
jgi:hypothetical protein